MESQQIIASALVSCNTVSDCIRSQCHLAHGHPNLKAVAETQCGINQFDGTKI